MRRVSTYTSPFRQYANAAERPASSRMVRSNTIERQPAHEREADNPEAAYADAWAGAACRSGGALEEDGAEADARPGTFRATSPFLRTR